MEIRSETRVLDQWSMPELPELETNREYEIGALRFELPHPSKPSLSSQVTMHPWFQTPPFGQRLMGYNITGKVLEQMCDHAAMVTNLFKSL